MSEISDFVRRTFGESDTKRDAGLTTPHDVERFDDIVYGDDPKWQILDVYRPREASGKRLPVIVSIHGGGWVYGNKEVYQFYCMSLAQHGFAVVNYTYRLAPEFKFPASIEDANMVFRWVIDHAEEYGFDVENIFGVGDSAGAHQLGLYAAICTNPAYASKYDFKVPEEFALKAIALNCGVYVIGVGEDLQNPTSTEKLIEDYLPDGGTVEEMEMINVVDHITEQYPPVFFMTCTGDFLIGQAAYLEEGLISNKIPHEFHFYGDREHELGHVFHCNVRLQAAAQCNKDECDFFKKFLK